MTFSMFHTVQEWLKIKIYCLWLFSTFHIHAWWGQSKYVRKFEISRANFEKTQNLYILKIFSEFYVLTCKIVAILRNLGINNLRICKKSQNWSKNLWIKPNEAKMDLNDPTWPQKCFIWKVVFFQKHQLGIGSMYSAQIGGKWSKMD